MKETFDNLIKALGLFLLAFIARLWYVFYISGASNILAPDSPCYLSYSWHLLNEGVYRSFNDYAFRPPGYGFFAAAVFYIFGYSIKTLKIIQIFVSSLLPVMIYFFARKIFSLEKVALAAASFSCFYFGLIIEPSHILSEVVFTPLFFASVLFLIKGEERNKWLFVSGLFAGAAAFTRPIGLLLMPFFLLWSFFRFGLKKSVLKFSLILIGFCLILAPWWIRNYRIFSKFVPVALETGFVFQHAYSPQDKLHLIYENDVYPEVERDERNFKKGLNYMLEMSLYNLIKKWTVNFLQFFYPFMPEYDFTYALISPFFLLGFYLMIKKKDIKALSLSAMTVYLPVSAFFFTAARYRHSMGPFIILAAFYWFDKNMEKLLSYKFRILIYFWTGLNFFVLFYYEQIRHIVKSFLAFF